MSNNRELKLLISGEAGSIFDKAGRTLPPALGRALGAPVAVENVGDSSGVGGAQAGALAPKDGSTILLCNKGAMTSHPHTAKTYQPSDFEPLCQVAEAPIAIAVSANGRFRSLASLLEAADPNGAGVSFSTPNPYHTQRLALEGFADRFKLKFNYVQIPGSNAVAIRSLLEGKVDFAFLAAHNLVEQRMAGDLRILGVAHGERLPFLPEDPTLREQGCDLVTAIWIGLFAPAGVEASVLTRLRRGAEQAVSDPAVAKAILDVQMMPAYMDGATFKAKVVADTEFHLQVLKKLGAL